MLLQSEIKPSPLALVSVKTQTLLQSNDKVLWLGLFETTNKYLFAISLWGNCPIANLHIAKRPVNSCL